MKKQVLWIIGLLLWIIGLLAAIFIVGFANLLLLILMLIPITYVYKILKNGIHADMLGIVDILLLVFFIPFGFILVLVGMSTSNVTTLLIFSLGGAILAVASMYVLYTLVRKKWERKMSVAAKHPKKVA